MLLRDKELLDLIVGPSQMISGFPAEAEDHLLNNPKGPNSPVQPSSVDLHIGEIRVPGNGMADKPHLEGLLLPPGHSVLVASHELLKMPADVGAAVYPLAGRRQGSILMLNPGHVDPGYRGRLWFSFINVGKDPFPMRQGLRVATALFWRMSASADSDFATRYPECDTAGIPKGIADTISGDTLMVDVRARQVAQQAVGEVQQELRKIEDESRKLLRDAKVWGTVLPAAVVILLTWLNTQFGWFRETSRDVGALKTEIAVLKEREGEAGKMGSSLAEVRKELLDVKTRLDKADQGAQSADLQRRIEILEKCLSSYPSDVGNRPNPSAAPALRRPPVPAPSTRGVPTQP